MFARTAPSPAYAENLLFFPYNTETPDVVTAGRCPEQAQT
jgi:hypothetical protein